MNSAGTLGQFVVGDEEYEWSAVRRIPHKIRVLRQTRIEWFDAETGPYVQQRFDVALIDEELPRRSHLYLSWMGEQPLVDLTGGMFLYYIDSDLSQGAVNPDAEAAQASVLRNESGQLLLAYGKIALEQQLSGLLPEFSWKSVDIGCSEESFEYWPETQQAIGVSLDIGGQSVSLNSGDSVVLSVDCGLTSIKLFDAMLVKGRDGVPTRIPSRIIFSAWREGMLEEADGGASQ